jgi:uncharacterized membrane protein YfcA
MQVFWIALIGVFGGVMSGLLGVGGGLIFVPLMTFFLGFTIHQAVGTSLLIIIPTSLIGVWVHAAQGHVQLKTALLIASFAIFGAWLGAHFSGKIDPILLKRIFAVFLVAIRNRLFITLPKELSTQ